MDRDNALDCCKLGQTKNADLYYFWTLNFPSLAAVVDTVVMELIRLDAQVHIPVCLAREDLLLFLPFSLSENQSWATIVSSAIHKLHQINELQFTC